MMSWSLGSDAVSIARMSAIVVVTSGVEIWEKTNFIDTENVYGEFNQG